MIKKKKGTLSQALKDLNCDNLCFVTAEDCGPLPVPTNGSSWGEKTTYTNQMAFSCDDGFIQRGSVIRKCQANGTWSGDITFCEGKLSM